MLGAHPALTVVLALAIGVVAQSVARHVRIPGIVLLLISGAALGPDGLAWIEPNTLGEGLLAIVHLAVAVILFEGGLNLDINQLRRSQAAIRRLVTWGALSTMVGGALVSYLLLDWPWTRSLLFGSLVVVTGPTVVGPIVRNLRLRPRVATVLEAEGVMIDPVGAILAVLMLEFALAPDAVSVTTEGTNLLYRVGFGIAAGIAFGFGIGGLLRVKRLVPEGLENVFVLACVLLLSEGCNAIVSHSGILAVTVAGVVVGNLNTLVDRDLREFKDQLSVMLIGLIFILLSASVRLREVENLGRNGLLVVAALVVVVRPITVILATAGSGLSWRERALIGWLAPRGIVAAAVASVTATALNNEGIPGGAELGALVFLTIAVTVLLAGFTAGPVATLLRLRLPSRDIVAILGVQGLGFLLGRELRDAGATVIFVDANAENCRRAQEAGFGVVFGDALQERILQRARFDLVGDVIGATANQMLNSVFVSRARERFGIPRGYVAVSNPEAGLASELVQSEQAAVLFDRPHDAARWEVRERHGLVLIEHWQVAAVQPEAEEEPEAASSSADASVILMLRRRGKPVPMKQGLVLEEGDVASVAIYEEEADAAREALLRSGWVPYEPPPEEERDAEVG